MNHSQKKYNNKRPGVRLPKETHEKFVDFCMENDLVMTETIGRFVEFCLQHAEFKTVNKPVEKLFIRDCEV